MVRLVALRKVTFLSELEEIGSEECPLLVCSTRLIVESEVGGLPLAVRPTITLGPDGCYLKAVKLKQPVSIAG